MSTHIRSVDRGANPYAPLAKQANQRLTPQHPNSVYQTIAQRAGPFHQSDVIQNSIKELAARMAGKRFEQSHFGELVMVPISLLDINIDIQRDVENEHQGKIIVRFDPRIAMPVMATRLKNGRYSAWEGQQTACVLYHLLQAKLIDENFLVQVKAFDEDLEVPGSDGVGEATGNYGFRQINGFRPDRTARRQCGHHHHSDQTPYKTHIPVPRQLCD